jgi:ribosomal protein L34E
MRPKLIEQTSRTERIVEVQSPGGPRYAHQFQDGEHWIPCGHCGDKLPQGAVTPGPVWNPDQVRKFCSAYRSSLKET